MKDGKPIHVVETMTMTTSHYKFATSRMSFFPSMKKTYLVGPDKLSNPWTALFQAY